jgi:putative peptidoglycan lipid II flippase
LIYSIIFAGGIIVAFLPVFSEYQKKDKEESWRLTNYILNFFIIIYSVFLVVFFCMSPEFISTLIGKFSPENQATATALTRLMFIAVFFFGLSSIFSTVLNYFNRFVAYSLAPLFYNLGIILGTVFLSPHFGIFGPGIGVVAGAFMHFAIQIPSAVKCGYKYMPVVSLKHPAMVNFFKLVLPRIVASSSSQIDFLAATFVASMIGIGSISVFNLSYNLSYLPIGVLGVSFATALFPLLSRLWAEGRKEEFQKSFRETFLEVLYIAFPVGILVFLLRNQIVDIIYRTGKFDESAVAITAACLGLYFLSTFTQCLVPIILRGYFSIKDTLTPTLIALVYLVVDVSFFFPFVAMFGGGPVFSFDFFGHPAVIAIPAFLANSTVLAEATKTLFGIGSINNFPLMGLVMIFNLSSLVEFALLFIFFYRKVGDFGIKKIGSSFLKIFAATVIMGFASAFVLQASAGLFPAGFLGALCQFGLVCLVAGGVYLLATYILKSPELDFIKNYFQKKFNKNAN